MIQCCNFFDLFHAFRCICKTDPAHSGIQSDMNMYGFILTDCLSGKLLCCLIFTDSEADITCHHLTKIFFKDKSQDQYRFFHTCISELQGFFCCSHCISPDVTVIICKTCNGFRTMAISVSFDHCDHFCSFSNIFLHFCEIMCNGIQRYHCLQSIKSFHFYLLLVHPEDS